MADQSKAAANATTTDGKAGGGTISLPSSSPTLDFSSVSVQGMTINDKGQLVITFDPQTGIKPLTIENFQQLAQSNATIALKDGKSIDTHSLYQTLAGALPADAAKQHAAFEIAAPHAGEMKTVNLVAGQDYQLPQIGAQDKVVEKGGALIITFADNGVLILANFEDAMKAQDATHLLINGKTLGLAELQDQYNLSSAHEQVAKNDNNLDDVAQQLAGVEPAAGPNGAGGRASAGGFGFQSSIDAAPLGTPPYIGPIGPTQLAFGLPEGQLQKYFIPTPDAPEAFPPGITVNGSLVNALQAPDAIVKEDHSIFVPITATLDSHGSANQVLTITVTGIDASWHLTNADGTYDAATGTWTITMPAGQNYVGGLTFEPPANADVDMTGLHGVATSYDPAANASASSSIDFQVITDAVADVPNLDAANAGVEGGHTVAIAITTSVTDTDGSEIIQKITVEGLPVGATLNHGTVSGGVWTLSVADLTGLTITVPKNTVGGDYNLIVKSYSHEQNLSGTEVDFTDNTAVATDGLTLHVTPNAIPIILPPAILAVDETNLAPVTGTSISGHVSVDYGIDAGGIGIKPNNSFKTAGSLEGGTLTSGGEAVTVATTANGYVGTANGATVFTFVINPNGDYTFTQFKPLDHADGANPNDVISLKFGVVATDIDGDRAYAPITINVLDDAPVAHNDVNHFYSNVGHTDGNVITGLHGGAGAADTVSHDVPNHVTKVQFGSTVVDVPETGTATIAGAHGVLTIAADGSYTYAATGGGSSTSIIDTPHHFTGNSFPTDLKETKAITGDDLNALGVAHSNMAVNGDTVVSGQITFEGAGYTNSFGAFTIGADGTLQPATMINPAVDGTGASFTLNTPASAVELGFFIVANGANVNHSYPGIDFSTGTLNFVYDNGLAGERAAKVTDAGSHVSLVYTDTTGHETVIDGPIFFTTDRGGSNSLNYDGQVHTISGVGADDTTLRIGFEDLPVGGDGYLNQDNDYNDIIFDLKLTDHTINDCGCGADQFTYTLADSDGDTSNATLTVDCVKSPSIDLNVNNGVHDAIVKEDHSVVVPVTAQLNNPSSASEALTVTVTGIQSSWGAFSAPVGSYNAATGTWTVTLAPGASLNTAFTFTPAHDSDIDLSGLTVTASATDAATGTVTAVKDFSVIVDAVADVPFLDADNATTQAGHTVALSIGTHVVDTDGSESIQKVTISGVPAGATLNHGTFAGGVWTLAVTDLAGLTINVPKSVAGGNYELTVKSYSEETTLHGTETDTSDNVAVATDNLTLCVKANHVPVITDPAPATADESNLPGGPIVLNGNVGVNYNGDGPGQITTNGSFSGPAGLTSEGQPVDVTHSGNTYTGTSHGETIFTLVVNPDGSYTFTLNGTLDHPNASDPDDSIPLNFGVTATDSDGDTDTGTIVINVLDDGPVAHNDVNTFNAVINHVETGNVITGQNGGAGAADDKSEDAPNIVSKVTFGGNTVNVTAAGTVINGDHGTLTIKADGSYSYKLTDTGSGAHVVDTFTYTLKDGDGDTSTATLKLDGTVGSTTTTIVITDNPPGGPGNPGNPNTPPDDGFPNNDGTVTANGGNVLVKEDHSVNVGIAVNATGSGSQVTTVTLSGINSAWGFVSHSGGTYNAATGTWTVTLAPGANLNGVFTFTPPANSDLDLNALHITASTNDPVTGRTSNATSDFNIVVDAVADMPNLSASNASGDEGSTFALNIATSVKDTDGSEVIQKVTISGLPTGATLNHGTVTGGVWTLAKADLADLKITLPNGSEGNYQLTVKSYAQEKNLGGVEVDLTDNIAVATTKLNLCVGDDSVPVVTNPDKLTVDETNLVPAGITATGHVTANYGTDGPGKITGTNTFTASTALTSNGQTVNVAQTGNTYTGTAGGKTIFTLIVNENGDYTFKLLGTLDHPNKADANDPITLNFGVKATDSDGDSANGSISIKVLDDGAIAHNDVNTFNAAVGLVENGNVITGANGGAGAADTLSKDAPNTISKVVFGTTSVDVPATGTATIHGDHGTLKIKADGSYTYTVENTGTGSGIVDTFTYTLKDGDGDTSTATLKLDGSVCPTTVDVEVKGLVNGNDVIVKEDNSVTVNVVANAAGSGTQAITLTMTGINPAWGFQSLNGGTYNAATGTWTKTLAAGENFNGNFTFTPPHDSDIDLSNVKVTATVNDPGNGRTATDNDTFDIIVDAVADKPNLSVSNVIGEQGHTVALNIGTSVKDVDGSEVIQKVTIAGLPAGATLNHGTVTGGVWTVSKADLADLKINVPDSAHGNYKLTVKSYSEEKNLGGAEVDLTDNIAVTTKTLNLCVTNDHVPILTNPAVKTVDETDMHGGTLTVSDKVVGNFGNDGPGVFSGNGAFTSSTNLFSNGVAVAVAMVGSSYIGTDPNDSITLNFGVKATDTDGDTAATTIKVNVLDDAPKAHDDFNSFSASSTVTSSSGNVITGAHGGSGAADSLSEDAANRVTNITHDGVSKAVSASGTTTIAGDYGTLSIKADGSYTYKLNDNWKTKTQYSFNETKEFPDLISRHEITAEQRAQLGIKQGALDVAFDSTVSVKFVSSAAGYDNTLGVFSVNADGTFSNVEFVVKNANNVTGAANVNLLSSTGQESLGFFIIADGAAINKNYAGLDLAHGSLSFVYDYGMGSSRTAKVTDNGSHVSLVFTDANGHETLLKGPTYFTTERGGSESLNTDGSVRVVSGLATDGDHSTLRIGFEDLPKLGDKDYDDVVFDVKVKLNSVGDHFNYTLTDGDGDKSNASLDFNVDSKAALGTIAYGTSGKDTLYGTSGDDKINGFGGGDDLYGGHGADLFVFSKISHGVDHIKDFNAGEGDTLDVSALLHGFDPVTDAINKFVFATTSGGNTIISVDPDGSGNISHATQIAVLENVTGVSVEDLIHHAATS